MRRTRWIITSAFVLALAVVAGVFLLRSSHKHQGTSSTQYRPLSTANLDEQDAPPLPNLSFTINKEMELEVSHGVPLIFTVRVANPRAANSAGSNQANQRYMSLIQERIARGEMTAKDAQPMLEFANRKQEVRIVHLGASGQGWDKFLKFELQGTGSRPEPLNWPLTLIAAPEAKGLTLDAESNAQVDYALMPEAAAQISAGSFEIVAALEVPTGGNLPQENWRGRVISKAVRLKILPAPAQPTPAEQAKESLQRAEFFSATKDWANAILHAQAALSANPQLISAEIIVGEAREAQGDLSGARSAYLSAKRLFIAQHPKSYEKPRYLIYKIVDLDARLGNPSVSKSVGDSK